MVSHYPDQLFAIKADNMYHLLKIMKTYKNVLNIYAFGEYAHASFREDMDTNELYRYLEEEGFRDILIIPAKPTIEDCFIKLLNN